MSINQAWFIKLMNCLTIHRLDRFTKIDERPKDPNEAEEFDRIDSLVKDIILDFVPNEDRVRFMHCKCSADMLFNIRDSFKYKQQDTWDLWKNFFDLKCDNFEDPIKYFNEGEMIWKELNNRNANISEEILVAKLAHGFLEGVDKYHLLSYGGSGHNPPRSLRMLKTLYYGYTNNPDTFLKGVCYPHNGP